jgi:hypothetical protein
MSNDCDSDDLTIPDEAELWRRIPPTHLILDHNLGRIRPTSAAFENHPDGSPMSVFLADIVLESGRKPEAVLVGHEGFTLASITAGLARECNQKIVRKPLDMEPAHAEVVGKKTDGVKKRFYRGCRWVIPPP